MEFRIVPGLKMEGLTYHSSTVTELTANLHNKCFPAALGRATVQITQREADHLRSGDPDL